jgi:hypothetical protein
MKDTITHLIENEKTIREYYESSYINKMVKFHEIDIFLGKHKYNLKMNQKL